MVEQLTQRGSRCVDGEGVHESDSAKHAVDLDTKKGDGWS